MERIPGNESSHEENNVRAQRHGYNHSKIKLFVGGLSINLTEKELKHYLKTFGKIDKITIIKTRDKESKGFGYVYLRDPVVATKLMQTSHFLKDHEFNFSPALNEHQTKVKSVVDKQRKVFVKGLSGNTTNTDLQIYFSRFGSVERATVNRFKDERSKRTAIILFKQADVAKSLLAQRNKKFILHGKELSFYECLTRKEIEMYSLSQSQVDPRSSLHGSNILDEELDSASGSCLGDEYNRLPSPEWRESRRVEDLPESPYEAPQLLPGISNKGTCTTADSPFADVTPPALELNRSKFSTLSLKETHMKELNQLDPSVFAINTCCISFTSLVKRSDIPNKMSGSVHWNCPTCHSNYLGRLISQSDPSNLQFRILGLPK